MILGKFFGAIAAQFNKMGNWLFNKDPIAQMQYEYDKAVEQLKEGRVGLEQYRGLVERVSRQVKEGEALITKLTAQAKAYLKLGNRDMAAQFALQLTKTLATLDEMDGYAASLVRRAEDSTKYLSTVNLPALVNEVKTLATRAATAKDPGARASFDQAKDARMDEIRSLKELRANKERIYADLMRVVALMCALPTKIVRLRALDAQAMEQLSGDITQDLQSIGEELQTSERVLRDLVPASRAREKVPA
jgi:phage shock protein A